MEYAFSMTKEVCDFKADTISRARISVDDLVDESGEIACSILSNSNVRFYIRIKGDTPLHKAVVERNINQVRNYLSLGYDCFAKNSEGTTPYDYAMRSKNKEIIDCLLANILAKQESAALHESITKTNNHENDFLF